MSNKVRNKDFLSLIDQEELLIGRNLHINEEDRHYKNSYIQKELLNRNYFDLINGFEDIFLDKSFKKKKYTNISIYDFIDVYDFDVLLSTQIFQAIETFEKKLKSRVAYFFSNDKCNSLNKVENYIDVNNYSIPSDQRMANKFKNHILFKKKERKLQGNKILQNFIQQNKEKYDYINRHDKLPFWVGIKTLTLGQTYWLLHGLPTNTMNDLLKSFNFNNKQNDKDIFLNSVYIITSLRNACAHFELITRFSTKNNFKIHKNLIKKLSLNPKRSQYEIYLYDTLNVLNQFVSIDEVVYSISDFYDLQKNKEKKIFMNKLLQRMGNNDITDWINLMSI